MVRGPRPISKSTFVKMTQHGEKLQNGGIECGFGEGQECTRPQAATGSSGHVRGKCGTTPQQSPRTVKRLTAVSNQLHKLAVVNNGCSRRRHVQDQGDGAHKRRADTIFQNWTHHHDHKDADDDAERAHGVKSAPMGEANNDEEGIVWSTRGEVAAADTPTNQSALKSILHVHEDASAHEHVHHHKPKKHVRISELRRGSLTGSLPDLTKASADDVQQSGALAVASVNRAPLPEGSDTFQTAMRDLDDGSGDGQVYDVVGNDSPQLTLSLRDLQMKHAASGNKLIMNRFRSKTAEVICVNKLVIPYPKYMERLGVDSQYEAGPESPTSRTPRHVIWKELDVADVSELTRKTKSMPNTPRSGMSPNVAEKCPLSSTSKKSPPSFLSAPDVTSTRSLSPISSSPVHISAQNSPKMARTSKEKSSLCRTHSLGSSAASARLLQRKQTTKHKLLARTRSSDA